MTKFSVAQVRAVAYSIAEFEMVTFDVLARRLDCTRSEVRSYVLGVNHLWDDLRQLIPPDEQHARHHRSPEPPRRLADGTPLFTPAARVPKVNMTQQRLRHMVRRGREEIARALTRARIRMDVEPPRTLTRRQRVAMDRREYERAARLTEALDLRDLLNATRDSHLGIVDVVHRLPRPVMRTDWAM